MWTCGRRAEERALVVECEAFFSGHHAQYLEDKNLRVPDWAWLNVLAHGSQDDIATLATGHSPHSSSGSSIWHQAVAFLAQELMSRTSQEGSLAQLQRSMLVPSELNLVGQRAPPVPPATFVSTVLGVLDPHPVSRHPKTSQ